MLPLVVILRFLKHVLNGSHAAKVQLAAHSGKVICVHAPLGPILVEVTPSGLLELYSGDSKPSLSIHFSPDVVLNWIKDNEVGWKGVKIEGDAHFASDLSKIVNAVDWDYEEDLSRIFGDVIAHRLGKLFRSFKDWLRHAHQSMKSSVGDYLTEESELLATQDLVGEFNSDVDHLNDAVERLEARIRALRQELKSNPDRSAK